MTIARSTRFLALGFLGSGLIHLVKPQVYEPIMPSWVPAHREVILGSGVAELALAAGLLAPPTRRLAGWGSVGLLLGVFPANVKMAADALGTDNTALKVGAIARLPGQWPMIKAALAATRRPA
ncbi:DoxX family protein [Nocardioides sp.]|uniref:DoxX family protein n=1 Tax=Nocardioides sp. TaxID=35761 RepID=UPI0027263DBA|nr:DoxX family protein [Nocardioides sp.]MDO9457967.1 DoxX family protein [Nocardioides sp.]